MSNEPTLLTLSVSLIGTEPEIWRTIEVDGSLWLPRFHEVLQSAMGWTNSHLHSFADRNPFEARSGGLSIVPRNWFEADSLDEGLEGFDEADETVAGALGYGDGKLWYEYDFGDSWMHVIREVSRRPRTADDPEARVLDGQRRAPLEDCGGIGGWAELLDIWADRDAITAAAEAGEEDADGERAFRLAWIDGMTAFGEGFDPDRFDVGVANIDLRLWAPADREDVAACHRAGRWLAGLDDWARHDFGRALHRAGIDPFGTSVEAGLPTAGPGVVAPYQWLIRACEHSGGLALTPKGNFTEAVVAQVLDGLDWRAHNTVWRGGKRENTARIVTMLRESALSAGIVRKTGSKLVATVIGRQAADRPEALWQRLVDRVLPDRLGDDQRDVGMLDLLVTVATPDATWQSLLGDIARGMGMLGYADRDGQPLDGLRFIRYVEPLYTTRAVLEAAVADDGSGQGYDRHWGQAGRRTLRDEFARAALQA